MGDGRISLGQLIAGLKKNIASNRANNTTLNLSQAIRTIYVKQDENGDIEVQPVVLLDLSTDPISLADLLTVVGKTVTTDWTDGYILVYDQPTDTWVMQAPGAGSEHDPLIELRLADDFLARGAETGEYGELGWISGGTGMTLSNIDELADHPGIFRLNSTALTTRAVLALGMGTNALRDFTYLSTFDISYIARLPATTAVEVELGLSSDATSAVPVCAAFFRYDASVSANWYYVHRTNTTDRNNADSGVAADTDWHRFQIKRSGTNLLYYIDDVLVATCANGAFPTGFGPYFMCLAETDTDKSFDVDLFTLKITGLTRY